MRDHPTLHLDINQRIGTVNLIVVLHFTVIFRSLIMSIIHTMKGV